MKKLREIADEIRRLTENQRLAFQYIQQILGLVDHEDASRVTYFEWEDCYHFENECMKEILDEPLKNPKSLTHSQRYTTVGGSSQDDCDAQSAKRDNFETVAGETQGTEVRK